jgi:hypothetical protein
MISSEIMVGEMGSFWIESFFYCCVAGFLQLCAILLFATVALPLMVLRNWRTYLRTVGLFCLFNAFLLAWGSIGNYLWLSLTWQKLYFSMDRVVDWFPYIPFGQWVLDQEYGGETGRLLNGATMGQLRFIWAAIATAVWALSGFSCGVTIWIARRRCVEKGEDHYTEPPVHTKRQSP